ncbi:AraC family transcriptional regulator [Pseudomonas sp. NPDC089547]|uniref:AraC family transcriptional regulator n=1 Tax=Pseudomonas sp. NPDC089547 TaxID=3390652 RepID=UPI003CFD2A74
MSDFDSHCFEKLAKAIEAQLGLVGEVPSSIHGLTLFRRDAPSEPDVCMVEPSVVLVARGEKRLWVGGQGYSYDPEHFLVTSLDLPAYSEVLQASVDEPCVGLVMKLDVRMLAELVAQGVSPRKREARISNGVGIGSMTQGLLTSATRLVELLGDPEAIPVLGPLIQKEIHFWLLRSDQSARLLNITSVDGQGYRIAKAIDWLKVNYKQAMRVEDLAAGVLMSPTSFHQHFRQLTAMSPLQYQKWLRLNEAKRLMLNEQFEVSRAAYAVGYESPSQFSREYSRLFGVSPKRDISTLRG